MSGTQIWLGRKPCCRAEGHNTTEGGSKDPIFIVFESEMTIMTIIEGWVEAGYEHADMDGGRGESEIQRID